MKRTRSLPRTADTGRRARSWRRAICAALSLVGAFILLQAGGNGGLQAQQAAGGQPLVRVLTVDGAIGPATAGYLTHGLDEARQAGADLVVIELDTPGGLTTAMREINDAVLASAVPVATYVAPSGARAASAGTYMLYASHIAAMAPGTTLGAATPVQMGGGSPLPGSEDGGNEDGANDGAAPDGDGTGDALGDTTGDAAEDAGGTADDGAADQDRAADATSGATGGAQDETQGDAPPDAPPDTQTDATTAKAVNDAVAYIRSLAQLRERNADWAERAVTEAATLTDREALARNVVDLRADDLNALLAALDGRTVATQAGTTTLTLADPRVERAPPDWRDELLATLTDPNVALILMMIGIYGLIFEFASPGLAVPGVLGAICLLLGLYALNVLPVNYAGLALMGAGVTFMVAEAFVPSFGALGLGGLAAFALGSTITFDTGSGAYALSWWTIGGVTALSGLVLILLVGMMVNSQRVRVSTGEDQLVGHGAEVASWTAEGGSGHGRVQLQGEYWNAVGPADLRAGQHVRITARTGLTLTVAAQPGGAPDDTSQPASA
jgi:membrane-bound serine protease (ClpP class)